MGWRLVFVGTNWVAEETGEEGIKGTCEKDSLGRWGELEEEGGIEESETDDDWLEVHKGFNLDKEEEGAERAEVRVELSETERVGHGTWIRMSSKVVKGTLKETVEVKEEVTSVWTSSG